MATDFVLLPTALNPPCPKGICPKCWAPVASKPGDAWAYREPQAGKRAQQAALEAAGAFMMRAAMGEPEPAVAEAPIGGLLGAMLGETEPAEMPAEMPALTEEQARAHGVPWPPR